MSTLWFGRFWGSLAPQLVEKYITPSSLAPPISQPRCCFSNTQLVVSQKNTKKTEPQWSCLAYPAKVLWSGEDTTPFRQKRIQGVLWLIFFLNLQIEHWPRGATSGASSNSAAMTKFTGECCWTHQGHYPTSWPRKLLECFCNLVINFSHFTALQRKHSWQPK